MKLALFGTGRMGRETEAVALERGHEVTARLDRASNEGGRGITPDALRGARVAVDFTTAASVLPNVRAAAAAGVAVVVGTTGWEAERAEVERAVGEAGTGLLHAPNFSLGMLLFLRVVEEAARLADGVEDYDVHLWEAHHRHKTDHPGGTARRLAETLVRRLSGKRRWETDLPPGRAMDPETLQVAVLRAGEIPGTHGVALEGPDDRIELRHEARSRRGFARGAVLAAEWLEGRSGIFTLDHLLADRLGEGTSDERGGPT
jgi:4-hydroxy-tetrahydrodipicolinate reductase